MVEEKHVELIALEEVCSKDEQDQEVHGLTMEAKGMARVRLKRLARSIPVESEGLRGRLRTWGLAIHIFTGQAPPAGVAGGR